MDWLIGSNPLSMTQKPAAPSKPAPTAPPKPKPKINRLVPPAEDDSSQHAEISAALAQEDQVVVRELCRLLKHTLSIDTTARLVTPPTPEAETATEATGADDEISAITDDKPKPTTTTQSVQAQLSRRKKVEMLDTTCTVLEMMFRKVIVKADHWKELVSLLVYVSRYCSIYRQQAADANGGGSNTDGGEYGPEGSVAVKKSIELFRLFSRVPSARITMAGTPGLLEVLVGVINSTDGSSAFSKVSAIWTLAYLAGSTDNMATMGKVPGLVDTLLNAADPDSGILSALLTGKLSENAREQAARAAMILTSCEHNQAYYLEEDTVINILQKLLKDENGSIRGYAAACFRNIASVTNNVPKIVAFQDTLIVKFLLETTNDPNDLVCQYAVEALKSLAPEIAAQELPITTNILGTMSNIANSQRSIDVKICASAALRTLADVITASNPKFHTCLLTALVTAARTDDDTQVYVNIAQALHKQATFVANRPAMITAELFTCLAAISSSDDPNVISSITQLLASLSLEGGTNREALVGVGLSTTLTNLVTSTVVEARDDSLRLIKRLAPSNHFRTATRKRKHFMTALMDLSIREKDEAIRAKVRDVIVLLLMPVDQ